jgi:hypothetical protein
MGNINNYKIKRIVRKWPTGAWQVFYKPIFNSGQILTFLTAIIGTAILLKRGNSVDVIEQANLWEISIKAFTYVIFIWSIFSIFIAPFKIVYELRSKGRWDKNHFVYTSPILIATERFEHNDGITQRRQISFTDAEPGAFVYLQIESQPSARDRVLIMISGGEPNEKIDIIPTQPGIITMASPPGTHIGIRLPQSRKATLYVRLEADTVPTILRVYCIEFFVGKDSNKVE